MEVGTRKLGPIRQPLQKPQRLGREYNPWYWNPRRAQKAPEWFLKKLRELGEELMVTWNPIRERWQVWSQAPRINHPICQGWRLLFIHHDSEQGYLPLDERLFARLYSASVMEHGSAVNYFRRVEAEMQRDREKWEKQSLQDTLDMAMPVWEYSQIKNIGSGSKFATYHA